VFLQGTLVEFARRLREASSDTELLLLMGNDDWAVNADCLEAHDGRLWHYLHERVARVHGLPVAGLSWVPITPFMLKDWERWEDGLEESPARLDGWVSRDGALAPHRFDPSQRTPTIAEALGLADVSALNLPQRARAACAVGRYDAARQRRLPGDRRFVEQGATAGAGRPHSRVPRVSTSFRHHRSHRGGQSRPVRSSRLCGV
jgi:hypothetical protein